MTSKIAEDCKNGIYWDFAPVVDAITNPANPIIGNRSFGSDINNVIYLRFGLCTRFVEQWRFSWVYETFPSHGDTDTRFSFRFTGSFT